jgi:hypothetical protein
MTNEGGSRARPPRVNELIASVSALLPALAAGSFVLSAAYDIGYFVRLGVNAGVVPTTLSDHTRSALLWLPLVAVALLFFGLVNLLDVRFPLNKWLPSHPWLRDAIVALGAPFNGVVLIALVLADGFALALLFYPIGMSFILVSLTWLQLFYFPPFFLQYLRSRRTSSWQPLRTSEKLFAIGGWVVLVPILGYLVALAETQIDVLHKHPWVVEFIVRATVKSQEPEVVFKVLRSFEKGVLVQDIDTAQILFFQWAEVLSLQYPTD